MLRHQACATTNLESTSLPSRASICVFIHCDNLSVVTPISPWNLKGCPAISNRSPLPMLNGEPVSCRTRLPSIRGNGMVVEEVKLMFFSLERLAVMSAGTLPDLSLEVARHDKE